ncbi:hypothetical protein H0H93_003447 [Arthromyces matolae]|nr:hypothetical protein H0H93_003447 [Arthromyces matolae]
MSTTSSGASIIFGVFSGNKGTVPWNDRPKTIAFPSETPIGKSATGTTQVVTALVVYFVKLGEKPPDSSRKYLICGKLISVKKGMQLGKLPVEYVEEFDIIVEAFKVDELQSRKAICGPVVTVAGDAGERLSDKSFSVEINQYTFSETNLTSHQISIPTYKNLRVPHTGSSMCTTGYINGTPDPFTSFIPYKRIPILMQDIAFLSGGGAPIPIVKGKPSTNWDDSFIDASAIPGDSSTSVPDESVSPIIPAKREHEHDQPPSSSSSTLSDVPFEPSKKAKSDFDVEDDDNKHDDGQEVGEGDVNEPSKKIGRKKKGSKLS